MVSAPPLSTIIALARAGSLDHAWAAFTAAGYDGPDQGPAALAVKGRLLKDRALRAAGEERRRIYRQSAEAYCQSAALQPGTYPLINAATLSLLSGDTKMAESIAREVLGRIAREPDEPETPYWKSATEAEALLLLGRRDEAEAALRRAIAAAPQAWEDHASTLRQFIAIHDATALDPAWLAMLRPPRSVHFGGRSGPPASAWESSVGREIGAFLDQERCGFGFGALAAGGDILCAEALIERHMPLHVVLPSDPASFAASFVDPFGETWRRRFDAALSAAETVELARPLGIPPDAARIALSDEIALGAALLHAERMMSEARQLVVGDAALPGSSRAVRTLVDAGPAPAMTGAAPLAEGTSPMLLALLALSVGSAGEPGFEGRLGAVRGLLDPVRAATIAPHLSGDCILIGHDDPEMAAETARLIQDRAPAELGLRIAGHFGFVACVRDPFQGTLRPTEGGAEIVRAIAGATPPGTVCVSHDLAAILAARAHARSGANWIGELQALDGGPEIGLYALNAQPS